MTIDWLAFTPVPALLGGLLIGLAATTLLLFNGRIAGISGILGGVLAPQKNDVFWRLAFLGGLVISPGVYAFWSPLPAMQSTANTPTLIAAGLLVGLGTRYGSGCTSGHGVCGLSRWSPRSMVATACFMAMGFFTVYVMHHVL
jgi:uncharacterized membrane protein YedE/YeeE